MTMNHNIMSKENQEKELKLYSLNYVTNLKKKQLCKIF